MSDGELVAAVVCLANTEGGTVYVGVEDDGTITGLHPEHQNAVGLAAFIANRTVPPLSVRATILQEEGKLVAAIAVPKSARLVSTSEGLLQRRRLQADGKPQCLPFYPHEFASRQSDLRALDLSDRPVLEATPDDLDPLERERLRQMVQRLGGDRSLLTLDDEELDGALGLVRRVDGRRVPTVAGLLVLGREAALRQHLPTHEVAFQVLEGTRVRVDDFYRWPLLRTFERVTEQFGARLVEDELDVGGHRIGVPTVDRDAFREALVNALVHRDYARLGAIHVRWESEWLTISNPGGFVEGVGLGNLLVVEPKPRNPLLADVVKRIGLTERTGRGIDRIYEGLLRTGRREPDYRRSDPYTVIVRLSCAPADLPFVRLVVETERRAGVPLSLDSLIVLGRLRSERRLDLGGLAGAIQKDEHDAREVVERLVEAGLVDGHGGGRVRAYTLSARVYRELGEGVAYVRQAGFDAIQQEQMVVTYVGKHGSIARKDVVDLCQITPRQATMLLQKLTRKGLLEQRGERKSTVYVRGARPV